MTHEEVRAINQNDSHESTDVTPEVVETPVEAETAPVEVATESEEVTPEVVESTEG